MKTLYLFSREMRTMEDVGPGDADVHTKSGRHTNIQLKITRPVVEPNGKRLRCKVVYDVIEGRRDFTHLQLVTDVLMPLPSDWSNVKVLGAADFSINMVVNGKNHQWIPVNVNSVNWIQELKVKIDGPGNDTEGNAGLRFDLAIPLEYEDNG
ncbi:MAG: hypothetical protein MUF18_04590 [Fimbriiglobus sp.]|nr:hypothetical protein [Fimbriiglobus sp.]